MDPRHRLFVAGVLRDSDAEEVNGLRRALGSSELDRIPPHITLVPPFNVAGSELVDAYRLIAKVAGEERPIDLTLGAAKSFPPDHHVIYLEVDGELTALQELRERCRSDPLVRASRDHERPFIPHVTLRSHASPELVDDARGALSNFSRAIVIDRLTLLCFHSEHLAPRWTIADEVELGGVVVSGRGGREIDLVHAFVHNAEDDALLARNGCVAPASGPDLSAGGSLIVLRAMVGGQLVGLCRARQFGPFIEIEEFVVDLAARRTGIGRQLALGLDRLARDRSVYEVRGDVRDDAMAFFSDFGYRSIGPSRRADQLTRVIRDL